MYCMWFCKIIGKDDKEEGNISSLEYMEIIYNDLLENQLEEFSRYYCEENGFIFDKMVNNHYCLFKDSDYCLFFEELLENDDNDY